MAKDSSTKTADSSAVDLGAIVTGLSVLGIACGATPAVILLPGAGKKAAVTTRMFCTTAGSAASFLLPFGVAGLPAEGLEVPGDLLSAAVKGGGDGTLTYNEGTTTLNVKSGRVVTSIIGSEYRGSSDVAVPSGEGVQQIVMAPNLLTYLNSVLPALKIERTHAALPEVYAYIRIGGGRCWSATADLFQFCWASRRIKDDASLTDLPDLKLSLPYERLASLVRDLPVSNCDLFITEEVLAVVNKTFTMSMALPVVDADSALDPETAFDNAKTFDKTAGDEVEVSGVELRTFLERSRALLSSGATVSFVPAKKGATVTVAGSRGSSVLRLASTLTKAFDVDYRYLNTVLRLAAPAAVKKGEEDAGAVKFLINDAGTMLIARGAVNYVGWLATKQEG